MRLITRNSYPLHSWNVRDYIKQAQANIIKQETHRFITMQNIFTKLYLRHLNDHEQLQQHINILNDLTTMSQAPARAITEYFHQKAKVYSESFMTASFQYLGKSYQISKSDNAGSLDTLGYKLFLSSEFGNLTEELKFALRNNKIQYPNLVTVIEALIKLEYVDYEIINLLLLYTQREIDCANSQAPLNNWSGDRQFQIQKKTYYNPEEQVILQGLRASPEVSTAISFVRHIYKEWQRDQQQGEQFEEHNIKELHNLIQEISQTNKNFRKIVEGIINVRREYVKMVDFSSDQSIMRSPNINLDLLNIEQKLLHIKLLSIDDIKYVDKMKDSRYEIKRIEEIITMYLDIPNVSPIFAYIDQSTVNVEEYKERTEPDPAIVSKLLNLLSQLSSLDRFVYHTQDGKNLVNLQWEKTLLAPTAGPYITSGLLQEQLNVSRIFRRVFTDILSFFNRNENSLNKIIKSSSINDKVVILDSYCRMGLQEKAIVEASQFQKKDLTLELSKLSKDSFATLIHLFNDIGIFVNNKTLKQQIFLQLKRNASMENNNRLAIGLRESIDIVNYLIQNHKEEPKFNKVYNRYIGLLEAKTTYFAPQEHESEDLIEAFKILALQRPDKYGSHPTYLNYIYSFVHDKYKKNPYHSILRETCYKWCRKDTLLNKMQTHLNLGVSGGIQSGLVFSNSEETSLDGQIRSGDLNSYILRLSAKNNMLVHEFSVNSFLNIDYSNQKQPFKLKPVVLLEEKLEEVFEEKTRSFDKQYSEMETVLLEFLEVYPEDLLASKIRFKLTVINKIKNNSFNLETKEQEYSNNALFLLEILQLNKLIRLIQEDNILASITNKKQPQAVLNSALDPNIKEKEFQPTIKVNVNERKSALREIKSNFFDLLQTISSQIQKELKMAEEFNTSSSLKGERQTLEVLQSEDEKHLGDISRQFLNHRYFQDKTFCEYKDWKQIIEKHYNFVELSTDKVTNLTKILTNKFCDKITNKVNLLPICKHSERLKKLDLDFKLLREPKQEEKTETLTVAEKKQLNYIVNLQTFKHELKTTLTPKTILDYIFGFKFVTGLNKGSSDSSKILLNRNPEEYFNYLEELHERSYLESPYAKYIIEKLSKTDNIRHLLEKRKETRIAQRIQYQQGVISAQTYFSRISIIEDQIIEAVGQLKTKMLDHMDNSILSGQLKMVGIKKDQLNAFEEILRRNFSYNRQFDSDFIFTNGDYQKAIHLKRGRAQNNYIKMCLLKKMAEKQHLSEKETQLLRDWNDQIVKGVSELIVYQEYSSMVIAELPWEDLQSLRLQSSALNSNKDMLVIDLIMELNLFLNHSLIETYERRVKAEHLSKKYSIPLFMFDQSSSEGFRHLQNLIEESLIRQHSKLQDSDLDTMQELFKILKIEGFRQRNLYASLCKNFRKNIGEMNQQLVGPQLIQEYIRIMDDEFMNQYNPALVEDIKEKETHKLWRQIFHHPYDNCTQEMLTEKSKQLILRIELLQGKCPPFFGNFILNLLMHPEISELTKETLIAAIEINRMDLNLDSSNIQTLSKIQGRQENITQLVKKQLSSLSGLKIGEALLERTKKLL